MKKLKINKNKLLKYISQDEVENCQTYLTNNNVNDIVHFKMSLIHYATLYRAESTLALLINYGANVNARDVDGMTSLHYINNSENIDIAEFLINNGANVNAPDNGGRTPLHYTTTSQNTVIAGLLIANGADLNAPDNTGSTPIYYAIYSDNFPIMLALLNARANLDVQNSMSATPLAYAMSINKPIALLIAIYQGAASVVAELINNGISFDYNQNTPLHIATSLNSNELIAIILNNAINLDVNALNNFHQTAIGIAIENENTAALDLLNSHIANAGAGNNMSAHEATTPSEEDWVEFLIGNNFEPLFSTDSFY